MNTEKGVLYIAFGDKYRKECAVSIRSLKILHPELPICVVTDDEWQEEPEPDLVLERKAILNLGAKPTYMGDTPFEETLYLDTDTIVVKEILKVFDLLKYYDIGINFRSQFLRSENYFLPWCNSGVILFRRNKNIEETFKRWRVMFQEAETAQPDAHITDDRYLPIAITEGRARVIHLASALNFFLGEPQTTSSPLRIIHSRDLSDAERARKINRDWNAATDWYSRVWLPVLKGFFPQGGLRLLGMWAKDPLIACSLLARRSFDVLCRLVFGRSGG